MYYWILLQYENDYAETICICDGKAEAELRFRQLCQDVEQASRTEAITVRMVTPAFSWDSKTIWARILPKMWPSVKERKFTKSE